MSHTDDRATWFEGQGLWQHVPESDWRDWTWQLKHRLPTTEQLEQFMTLTTRIARFASRSSRGRGN